MIRAWYTFYQKIFIGSLILTGIAGLLAGGLTGENSLAFYGFIYAILSPIVHLVSYELNHPQEYYFYANLGLIRGRLWQITGIISLALLTLSSLYQ